MHDLTGNLAYYDFFRKTHAPLYFVAVIKTNHSPPSFLVFIRRLWKLIRKPIIRMNDCNKGNEIHWKLTWQNVFVPIFVFVLRPESLFPWEEMLAFVWLEWLEFLVETGRVLGGCSSGGPPGDCKIDLSVLSSQHIILLFDLAKKFKDENNQKSSAKKYKTQTSFCS